jgi:hypothetical protein
MNSIIFGNGINIQFGGLKHSNKSIIKRAIKNVETGNFSTVAYTKDILDWFRLLFANVPKLLKGHFNKYAVIGNEKKDLNDFKNRYNQKVKIYEIVFEDYFFIHTLFCRKNKIGNPEQYEFRELIKRFFLDSIYCDGEINEIYKNYPKSLFNYLSSFDNLYTTNYDRNLEIYTGRKIEYLHGAFHILDDVYNPVSFRNQLSDRTIEKMPDLKGIEYLFCNALSDSSGDSKDFSGTMSIKANSAIEKMTHAYQTTPELKKMIDKCENADNSIVNKLYESVKLKLKNPNLKYSEEIAIEKLRTVTGKLTLIGLSPYNDNHLFERINNNVQLTDICFYYYDYKGTKIIADFLNDKNIAYSDVNELWTRLENSSA